MEKASDGSFARTTRKTAEDEGRRREREGLGQDANRSLRQKVGHMIRVFQADFGHRKDDWSV
jgi:hypothetical protein